MLHPTLKTVRLFATAVVTALSGLAIAHEGDLVIIRPARLIRRADVTALCAFCIVIIASAGVVAAYPIA